MDSNAVKWLCFTGSAEDYPAWSTKFTAFMQTKGLFKSLLGKEVIPEEIAPLAEDASAEQQAQRQAKVQQRNKEIEDIKERNNNVWCHIALALEKTSLMYIRHDCLSQDGTGDGAKAWRFTAATLFQRGKACKKPVYKITRTVVYKENNRKSIRQWQCTPEVDVTEIRKHQCNAKFVMSVEIQDILQNNATREAQQFAPNATNEVI